MSTFLAFGKHPPRLAVAILPCFTTEFQINNVLTISPFLPNFMGHIKTFHSKSSWTLRLFSTTSTIIQKNY